jgi:polyhydroxyalkanoate synthesis repressor PhaR
MARIIKRYENRKLYDTEASSYVSLDDVAELVRRGETVQVVDNVTGQDITAQTLTQIILEEGKTGRYALPSDLLHDLLRRSSRAFDTSLDQIRRSVDEMMELSLTQMSRLVRGPRAHELEELRERLRHMEGQLSRILDAIHQPGASSEEPSDAEPSPNGRSERG